MKIWLVKSNSDKIEGRGWMITRAIFTSVEAANAAAVHPEFCRHFGTMGGPLDVDSSEAFDNLEEALAALKRGDLW